MSEEQSAVVPEIVTDEPFRNRRLRRACLHGGVGVDCAVGGIESWIRDSINTCFAIVVRHMLYQPVDRVVGIAGFIDIFR